MNKIEVYHAGTEKIINPIWNYGRKNLDFGPGFYLTDIYDQAVIWAKRKSRERKSVPLINVYKLDRKSILDNYKNKIFSQYNREWLDFIVACRNLQKIWMNYDYIEGGVADDRVIDTINLYIQGFISEERALENLFYLKPNNQICINNQEILNNHLEYLNTLELPSDELL